MVHEVQTWCKHLDIIICNVTTMTGKSQITAFAGQQYIEEEKFWWVASPKD
jgi:hypothetical protein